MQLGLGSYAYAWAIGLPGYSPPRPMTTLDFIRRAADLGLNLVQIADNLPLHRLSAAELDTAQAEADALGIRVEVGTRGIAPEHLRAYLALAQRFQSPIVRVVVDTATHHPAPGEVIGTLRQVMPDFEAAQVTLAIENHDRFRVRTLVEIIAGVGSGHVGICLDTVNSFGAAEGPETVVDVLGPHVVNLHVKDFTVRRHTHTLGFEVEGTPAGKGMLDVPWLLERLQGFGWDGSAVLETWPPPEPDLAATIDKEDAWAAASVDYLRGLIPA